MYSYIQYTFVVYIKKVKKIGILVINFVIIREGR